MSSVQAGCHEVGYRHSRAYPQPPRHRDDQPYIVPTLHNARAIFQALSHTHTNTQEHTHKVDPTYYSHLSHWAVQTLNPAYTSLLHTLTVSTHRLPHSSPLFLTTNSLQLLPLHLLDFLFSTPSALHPLSYLSLPPLHSALLVLSSRMLASTMRIVTANPYFQPVTPRCPVGCCSVGIWCSGSQIMGF